MGNTALGTNAFQYGTVHLAARLSMNLTNANFSQCFFCSSPTWAYAAELSWYLLFYTPVFVQRCYNPAVISPSYRPMCVLAQAFSHHRDASPDAICFISLVLCQPLSEVVKQWRYLLSLIRFLQDAMKMHLSCRQQTDLAAGTCAQVIGHLRDA